MFDWHHMVTVGTNTRVPFACESCGLRATGVVSLEASGHAVSGSRNDPHAAQAAAADARTQLATAVPRLAALARCPRCGHRSASEMSAARARGTKIAGGGAAAMALGLVLALAVGGPIGWVVGSVAMLFGVILLPAGLFAGNLAAAGSDRSVRFEP